MSDTPADDFAAMARRAQRLNDGIADMQNELVGMEATGHGGGGLVRATVSGKGRLVALDIAPSVIDPRNPRVLSGMVMEAVDAALESMAAMRAERVTALTGGLAEIVEQLHRIPARRGSVEPMFPSRRPGSSRPPLPFPPGLPGPPANGS